MPPTGEGRVPILFVGEAPGEEEDRQGEQFVGTAGQLLRKDLRKAGIDLDDCWKTNAAACRPPKNEISDVHIESCRPLVMKAIQELKPKVIVLLGGSAVKSVIGPEWAKQVGPLGRWVGWAIPSGTYNAWLCPTYHPSYLSRLGENETLTAIFVSHLKQALACVKREPPILKVEDLQNKVECVTRASDFRMRLLDLSRRSGYLAFDYETTGLKPDRKEQRIVSAAFCLDGKETFAGMVDPSLYGPLSKVLRNKNLKKIASNLKYEERWTRAKLGHGVASWFWDTMIAAHYLDNRRGITSVKFQSYVLLGVPDYDVSVEQFLAAKYSNDINNIDQVAPKDLLLYNGMDALLEFLVMMKQREQVGWKTVRRERNARGSSR